MKKTPVMKSLLAVLAFVALISPGCPGKPDLCIWDDNGQGAGISVPENECDASLNNPNYGVLMLTGGSGRQSLDVDSLVFYLEEQLSGTVKGWQLAVGYEGKVIRTSAGGLRSGSEDCPRSIDMSACQKMNIGSQTKTYVTVAVLKLLEEAGLDPFTERLAPYVPADWNIVAGVDTLTFAHFLGHRNGFGPDIGTSREKVKAWFVQGIVGTVGAWNYRNSNFNLMRVIFPKLLEKAKGIQFQPEEIDTDEECSALEVDYIMSNICQPLGNFEHILEWENDASAVLRFSGPMDNDGTRHTVYKTIGAGSMLVSARNMVEFYMGIFEKKVISAQVLDYMVNDNFILGFNQVSSPAPFNSTAYAHGGTLEDFLSVTIKLPGDLYVSCAVNSKPCEGCGSSSITTMVQVAYQQAFL